VEGLRALSALGGQDRTVSNDAPLSTGQRAAVRSLAVLYGSVGTQPPGLTPAGAYLALRGEERGYGSGEGAEDRVGSVATYRESDLSLPSGRAGILQLSAATPDQLLDAVSSGAGLLRSPSEAAEAIAEAGITPATDPAFARRPRLRGSFLHQLFVKGVIEVGPSCAVAGTFFVRKKGKKIRLIFDTRVSNLYFKNPHHTCLSSGEALSDLQIDGSRFAQLASGDVEACYYQYELPEWAKVYFGLAPIDPAHLSADVRRELGVSIGDPAVQFRSRVVPMGWAWGVHLIQHANLFLLDGVLPDCDWSVDKRPAAVISSGRPAKVLYIDNFGLIGVDGDPTVPRGLDSMLGSFARVGVGTTRDDTTEGGELLGFELRKDGGRWRPTRVKFWRVALALRHMLRPCFTCTGADLEIFVGHLVALFTIRREFYSLLHAVYAFIHRSYLRRQPLWASVRAELQNCYALLPTVEVSMTQLWHERVEAYDASLWGGGVVEQQWSKSDLQAVGSLRERCRWRGPLGHRGQGPGAREHAMRHIQEDSMEPVARIPSPVIRRTDDEIVKEGELTDFFGDRC